MLAVVPYWAPPDPNLPNVAAKLGYNLDVAYLAVILWSAAMLLILAIVGKKNGGSGHPKSSASTVSDSDGGKLFAKKWLRLEWVVVFVIFFAAYFPMFLARHGDFIEDKYFLSSLARMVCGDRPYTDFEFLYGPMMISPAYYWTSVFGFSFASYYAFVGLLQGSFFAVLMATLQRYLADWRMRYVVFALLALPLFDVLLGLNYVGWRRMLPVFAIMIIAARPFVWKYVVSAGAILGFSIAYSYEFGLVGLAACAPIYGVFLLSADTRLQSLKIGSSLAAISIAFGVLFTFIATGGGFAEYLAATGRILAEASDKGLGAFKFYWTAHSLSMFALLAVSIVVVGLGTRRLMSTKPAEGDLLLIGGLTFALISLKVAFQRADIWHMVSPFLPLSIAFLVRPEFRLFPTAVSMRPAAFVLVGVASISTAIGYLPMGMYYGGGLASGAADVLSGTPRVEIFTSRQPSVQRERTRQSGYIANMARHLAEDGRETRPVMFYKDVWALNHHLGVCPIGYTFYDLIYSDRAKPLKQTLSANEDAYVIMNASTYELLKSGDPYQSRPRNLRLRERMGIYMATVHYSQSPIENEIEFAMWKEALGDYVVENFEPEAQYGPLVLLSRRGYKSATVNQDQESE